MLKDLGLLGDVTMARQDSGQLARFSAIFPDTKRMARGGAKRSSVDCRAGTGASVSSGRYRATVAKRGGTQASEIENYEDIAEALKLGYGFFGA